MDLLADESLATNEDRLAAQDRLMPQLEAIFASLPLEEIVRRCEAAEIPFSPIAHPEDLFEDPQLNAGDSLVAVHLPDGRQTKLPRLPLALDGARPALRMEAPQIGEHTRSLLLELDYSQENIDDLHQAEVVVAPPLS
jgi:crotonobetainyl-CoA:carnitine CoA-transferase CaiB-like acyl-CoA transferase